eukprot:GHUV01009935.1.p2 GENE.GHUV01009935.1~~GHUV01009935.1.p2  ORF type:complete len:152 (-),score=21.99 GHUV01009935.1:2495-2950(-)
MEVEHKTKLLPVSLMDTATARHTHLPKVPRDPSSAVRLAPHPAHTTPRAQVTRWYYVDLELEDAPVVPQCVFDIVVGDIRPLCRDNHTDDTHNLFVGGMQWGDWGVCWWLDADNTPDAWHSQCMLCSSSKPRPAASCRSDEHVRSATQQKQ